MAVSNRRIALFPAVVLLVVFLGVCLLVLRPRFITQQGVRALTAGHFDQAVFFFERADAAFPGFLNQSRVTAADRFHLYTAYGRALYHSGIQAWQQSGVSRTVWERLISADECLKKAQAIDSGYYVTAFWRARTVHALQILYPVLFPGSTNPYHALDLYRTAAALRPAGIAVHQAYARYLHETGQPEEIPSLVQHLMSIYPLFYPRLKKEPYFAPSLLPVAAQGLEQAVQAGVRPREALRNLSRLSEDQDDPAGAIAYFKACLAQDPKANTSNDFIHLGALYLTDGRYEDSHAAFVRSLAAAQDPDAVLTRIYRIFKSRNQVIRFLDFADVLETGPMKVATLDLVWARCYLDLDQVFLAKQTLAQIIADNPTGPACYLRAQIAAREKDWKAMETYSQQATRIDPYNSNYHYYFGRALYYRKKYEDAEYALTRALRHAGREPAGYFHLRAWTRWHQKKYLAAAEDWDRAAALKPDHPEYADRAAQAREKSRIDPKSEYNQTRF